MGSWSSSSAGPIRAAPRLLRWSRVPLTTLSALLLGSALVACGDSPSPVSDGPARDAAVVEAVIRELAFSDSAPDPDDPALPVVFVVGADETDFSIAVQAEVASAFVDEADVRFADQRSEAIDSDDEAMPVRDDGVLLAIGPVDDERARAVDVVAERYRSIDERQQFVVSARWSEPEWVVTSTTVVPDPID